MLMRGPRQQRMLKEWPGQATKDHVCHVGKAGLRPAFYLELVVV